MYCAIGSLASGITTPSIPSHGQLQFDNVAIHAACIVLLVNQVFAFSQWNHIFKHIFTFPYWIHNAIKFSRWSYIRKSKSRKSNKYRQFFKSSPNHYCWICFGYNLYPSSHWISMGMSNVYVKPQALSTHCYR